MVVVAEGAGEDVLGQSTEVDAGGNRKLPKIGDFLVGAIKQHFKEQGKKFRSSRSSSESSACVGTVPQAWAMVFPMRAGTL